ncbi:MAG: FkbM family methyltransferase [Verrucomicrobiae bacterium]
MSFDLLSSISRHPANRSRRLRALARGALWQVWKRATKRPLTICYHGFDLRCYPDSRQASAAIYFGGWPDFWEMKFLHDYLRPGDRFVDVGANIGLYSLLAAKRVGPQGKVCAFEPGGVPAERLREACALNGIGQVEVVPCAAGERSDNLNFVSGTEDATAHIASQNELSASSVPAVRLDEFLDGRPLAMAKFDIEGYEPFALRGMSRLLEAGNPPVFLMEAAGYSTRYGIETHDLLREIARWGYRPMIYEPCLRQLCPAPAHWEMGLTNVLCVFDGAEEFVSRRLLFQP